MTSAFDTEAAMWFSLTGYEERLTKALAELKEQHAVQRMAGIDGSLWTSAETSIHEIEHRLAWLYLPRDMGIEVSRLLALAAEVQVANIDQIVLLGMGGSSLAPEVMRLILGVAPGHPDLTILDSTDPDQVRTVKASLKLKRTLFLVCSKSGSTAETLAGYAYFRAAVDTAVDDWSRHFVAITDPGSKLETMGNQAGFRAVYTNTPDVGGRYSALSLFGLVPAALIGIDLDALLQRARDMANACRPSAPAQSNPGLVFGAILGALATAPDAPRDKLTLITSDALAPFGPWAEQLIAESTGKDGVGILPIEGEDLAALPNLSQDRLYVYLRLADADNTAQDALMERLLADDQPVVVLRMEEPLDLGAEFYRWEYATAIAGVLLGINPFDQPNVESAKVQAREALAAYKETKTLPSREPLLRAGNLSLYGPALPEADTLPAYLKAFAAQKGDRAYVALMAYIERNQAHTAALQKMRTALGQALGVPVTVGFGPRFLHSTGQLHKGDGNTGLFIQIVRDECKDLSIPGQSYSFGVLKQSQALGDQQALEAADRKLVVINIGNDPAQGLAELAQALEQALS